MSANIPDDLMALADGTVMCVSCYEVEHLGLDRPKPPPRGKWPTGFRAQEGECESCGALHPEWRHRVLLPYGWL